ncbi:MAG: HyaD/HybD family hydrogenase maturation endopeptidase [Acidihalobacter sp.]|uniref:HyaD/HybD family hydrogenase maturation endopeptidase n=1 Tax=Acidihalobacter sp. TaxID=1872108 RepID=UPI00307D954C
MSHTLVLGLGNTLLGDEGVGIYAVQRVEQALAGAGNVRCLDGGTLSFTLAGPIEDSNRLIVIDAAELRDAPGSVQVFEGEEMDRYVGTGGKRSVHEVSLADLLAIACLAGRLPEQRVLIGIQPEFVEWADAPTPAGMRGIGAACTLALELIRRWEQPDAA